ncbi:MAG: (Fe-S)-binding protein [Ruminococcaceae bacterium]|nr:(Fe-S)-binding protein [Oscillospiraceae bacterium]
MNETSKKHVDSCRFCWMCRHICPIGNTTGLERNNARARALGLSLVNRGVYDISEVIDNIYECACCGACTKECVTGWDPVMFIKEARLDAALEGKLPEYINVLLDNCLDCGNAYGKTELDAELKNKIAEHSELTDTLLFLGVDARYIAPDCAVKAIKALEKAGVKFTVLEDELASGQQLEYLISAADETKQQMIACAKQINQFKTVVAYDPQDAKVFKREYKEWNVELLCDVKTYTAFVAELVESGKINAVNTGKKAVFQDPFQLARDLAETDAGRKIASAFCDLGEMLVHGKDTMWAGNILMAQWMPKVINGVALDRINNAKGVKADAIITASVSEYVSLKAVAEDVEIISVEELILG